MSTVPLAGPAVVVQNVGKTFSIPQERVHTLKERALHPLRRAAFDRFEALHDISFSVEHGEFFGIVGRNGSGKSTLLKCLAGIYGVDDGMIAKAGRMSTFIELGVGFNPDLAARDNTILNAIMLGLDRSEAEARYDRVIEFAELEDFQDLKIKNYSSGMLVRLAFSVMIQVDADILLIDEVLAVGDASFQQKCFDQFSRLREERRTILFVTHDMGAVNRYCDRAMLLEKGRQVMLDEPAPVGIEYFELNFGRGHGVDSHGEEQEEGQTGDGRARIIDAWFEDAEGRRVETLPQRSACSFCFTTRFRDPVQDPAVGVSFEDANRNVVFATSSIWTRAETGSFLPGDELTFRVTFETLMRPGKYYANPAVAPFGGSGNLIDRRDRFGAVQVTGTMVSGGMVDLPHDVVVARTASREAQEQPL